MATSDKLKTREGDWTCQNKGCANINFAYRGKCNKCGAGKPRGDIKKVGIEIGRDVADRSGGLFSADDWMCKSCGNVNWARRSSCNECHAPRIQKPEERTGMGGGFKDRDDVVEYNKKNESDDEYDEFGIKKKKFRAKDGNGNDSGNDKANSSPHVDAPKPLIGVAAGGDDEGDDDDDDDDDGDGDLDKYNLDDFGGDSVQKTQQVEKQQKVSSDESEDEASTSESESAATDESDTTESSPGSSSEDGNDREYSPKPQRNAKPRSRSRSPIQRQTRGSRH